MIDQSLLRRTVVEVANLPDDDLAILLDVVALLKQQRTNELTADIRRAARRRAMEFRGLPRDQLAAQLREVGEQLTPRPLPVEQQSIGIGRVTDHYRRH